MIPRSKTDETNRSRVAQITVTGIANTMQWNAIFLWQSYGIRIVYLSPKVSASWDVTGRPPLRYLLSTFPETNRLYRPSRPASDFVGNFLKDDLNRLVSSWNLQMDDIKSSDGRYQIVRLKSAQKIAVRFRVQGLRRTRRIDLELPKLQSRELPLLCIETQYSCDNPTVFESYTVLPRYRHHRMSQEGHHFSIC